MAGSDKITPAGEKLLKELKKLKKLQVRVGVQGGKLHTKRFPDRKEKLGADLVDIAIWNELGTDKIPARPFWDRRLTSMEERFSRFLLRWCRKSARVSWTRSPLSKKSAW